MNRKIRYPAVAGRFYPANPDRLQKEVTNYISAATPKALSKVHAVIAPHAGYVCSAPTAAFAYKLLADQPTPPERIYLIGPSHHTLFYGVALADYDSFQTPLGEVRVDKKQVQRLTASSPLFTVLQQPHNPEHCLEVHLPFLQTIYADIPIVPMLFGDVNPDDVGQALIKHLGPRDLIIASSDLSHYHHYEQAHSLDHQFLDAILACDESGVKKGEACGQTPALALMKIAKARDWHPQLLDYRTSGDTCGDRSSVVGYAAVAYAEGA